MNQILATIVTHAIEEAVVVVVVVVVPPLSRWI